MWNASITRRGFGMGVFTGLVASSARLGAPLPALEPGPRTQVGEPQDPARGEQSEAGRWDRVFSRPQPAHRTTANDFLARALERMQREKLLPGTSALDLAMGDGRNALLMAEKGLAVTGLDISKVALEQARARAAEKHLELQALEQDLFTFYYGTDRWDLITVVYFNPAVRIFDALMNAVKPDGLIVIEGQGSEHLGDGPPPATRFRPNQLLQTFRDWRILHYEDGLFECDWALGPPTHVVRLMARKSRLGGN